MSNGSYPYLSDFATDREYALSEKELLTCGGANIGEIVLGELDPDTLAFRIELEAGSWVLQPGDGTCQVCLNQNPITQRQPLTHLDIIQCAEQVFVFVEHAGSTTSSQGSKNLWLIGQLIDLRKFESTKMTATLEYDPSAAPEVVPLRLPGSIELAEAQVLIGRHGDQVDVCLPDVSVSRVHASILRDGRSATIVDLKSANGTFVNGRAIHRPTTIKEGDRIHIGPYDLVFHDKSLCPVSQDNAVHVVAQNLTRRVADWHRPGNKKVILDDVSLVLEPRNFVCVLGPSGSGKSTLLSTLSARIRSDEGIVLVNGQNLHEHFDALKQNLAVVPQREVLHDVLPLNLALWYTAKLRLPVDSSRNDIEQRVDEMLESVNLTQHQFNQIRRLSGGQVKRASCINELICNPSLIFLDEVTSGLDEQTDRELMQQFRQMADGGKTIVCVTHRLSNVEETCDQVVILATGGALAFVGSPQEAMEYFEVSRLGDVYQRLKERSSDHWKQDFRESVYFEQNVKSRLPDDSRDAPRRVKRQLRQPNQLLLMWRQFALLTRRYLAVQRADWRSLALMFGQSVFIAGLLVWLFGNISDPKIEAEAQKFAKSLFFVDLEDLLEEDQEKIRRDVRETKQADRSSRLLFLLCISSLWFGCNSAANEIVKERSIFSKERDVGLQILSYYGSKLALLGILCVLQSSLLYFVVQHFTKLSGVMIHQWLLLSLVAVAGVALGLAISAFAKTEDFALTAVPICLIPQIILAGLIAPLTNYTREFSQIFISSYWSYQGLIGTLDDQLQSRLRDSETLDLSQEWTMPIIAGVIGGHVICFSLLTLVALYARRVDD